MIRPNGLLEECLRELLMAFVFWLAVIGSLSARSSSSARAADPTPHVVVKKSSGQDDSVFATPAKDLLLRTDGQHKADALAHFVEGISFEEQGEMDKALIAYRKVLDVGPGQAELASPAAGLLTPQDEFTQA